MYGYIWFDLFESTGVYRLLGLRVEIHRKQCSINQVTSCTPVDSHYSTKVNDKHAPHVG